MPEVVCSTCGKTFYVVDVYRQFVCSNCSGSEQASNTTYGDQTTDTTGTIDTHRPFAPSDLPTTTDDEDDTNTGTRTNYGSNW